MLFDNDEVMFSRSVAITLGTIDESSRSARVVLSTENPAIVYDWDSYDPIREILLMDGVVLNEEKQIVMLNNHSRYSGTQSVKGSIRDLHVEQTPKGKELVGRAYFASTKDVEDDWTKVKEKHLTDVSVGYRTFKEDTIRIKAGETGIVNGNEYRNDYQDKLDLVIRRRWKPKEGSLVPIGADEKAKFRSDMQIKNNVENKINLTRGENGMDETLKKNDSEKTGESQRSAHEKEMDEAKRAAENAGVDKERKRVAEINSRINGFRMDEEKRTELIDRFNREGTSIDDATRIMLDVQREYFKKQTPPSPGTRESQFIQVTEDEALKQRSACTDSLVSQLGVKLDGKRADEIEQNELPRGFIDMARYFYAKNNPSRSHHAITMTKEEAADYLISSFWHGGNSAFRSDYFNKRSDSVTSGEIPYILMDAINKVMGTRFNQFDTTWDKWADVGNVDDFKTVNIISMSHFSDWVKVRDGEAIPYGSFRDKYETATIDTYGRGLSLPRKAIINDDKQFLSEALSLIGVGQARHIEDLVYRTLVGTALAGPNIVETGAALFTTGKTNLIATSGVLGTSSLSGAIKVLAKLPLYGPNDNGESRSQYTNVIGTTILTGIDKQFDVMQLVESDVTSAAMQKNVYKGKFKVVFSPTLQYYLSHASYGNKANAWYLMADPSSGYVLCRVYFLNGRRTPILRKEESRVGQPLGISFEGYLDYGVAFPEWRAAVCGDGA